jgi:putative FmdB family regulatory protein
MYDDYSCENCGEIKEVNWNINESAPSEVTCEKCGGKMKRVWGKNKSIVIPENFKAVKEDEYHEHLRRSFKSHRPSDDAARAHGKEPRGKKFF